jgi:hypothetical protein
MARTVPDRHDAEAHSQEVRVQMSLQVGIAEKGEVRLAAGPEREQRLGDEVDEVALREAAADEEQRPPTEDLREGASEGGAGVDRLLVLLVANHDLVQQGPPRGTFSHVALDVPNDRLVEEVERSDDTRAVVPGPPEDGDVPDRILWPAPPESAWHDIIVVRGDDERPVE